MQTYQKLKQCGDNEQERIKFIKDLIAEHENSPKFKIGVIAGQFYRHEDKELDNQKNIVFDSMGNPHEDTFTPNSKNKANFYYDFIDQAVQYELGNGISFDNDEIQKKLGTDFAYKIQDMLTYASNDGISFAFFDTKTNELTPMCFACNIDEKTPYFAPMYDEDNGKIMGGARYWRLDANSPQRVTLYEPDGFTELKENEDGELQILEEKQPYRIKRVSNEIEGEYESDGDASGILPIVYMDYINSKSALDGNIENLHSYNQTLSGFVNNTAKNTMYWVLRNCDGMDPVDDNNFVINMIKGGVMHLRDGVEADAKEVNIQYDARETLLTRLNEVLHHDFQAVDTKRVAAGNVTTVEIKSAYDGLNRKCDKLEKYISRTIQQILVLMGYDKNEPFHFQRAKEINELEAMQTLNLKAPYYSEEAATKEVLEISGKIDEFDKIQKQKAAEALARANMIGGDNNAETE